MNDLDARLTPLFWGLADWSVRWGVLILLVGAGLALARPRRPATRLLLCRLALAGGLALPLLPCWWGPTRAPAPGIAHTPTETPAAEIPAVRPAGVIFTPPPGSDRGMTREETPAPAIPVPVAEAPRLGLPAALALAWLAGAVVLLGRLALGWAWLARLRRAAGPAGAADQELWEACRAELVVRRPADLITHPEVRAPVLIGGPRPAVAVPPDWHDLPAESRRAALLHELVHLGRRDDWAKAGEELVRAAFFFHPLVRWLLGRLDGERERCCDAAVVGHGLAPRRLARALLDFAARQGAGRPPFAAVGAVPFFHRVTVKERIHHLLEDDMTHWVTPPSRGRTLALLAGVLGLAVGLGGFGVRAGAAEDRPKPPAVDGKAASTAEVPRATALEGRVLDAQGRPVPQARIVGLCRAGTCVRLGGETVTTDAQGHFRIARGPEGSFPLGEATALEVALPGGKVFEVRTIAAIGMVEVRLPTLATQDAKGPDDVLPDELAGVVVDEQGKPLEGVHVHVWDWVDRPENQARTGKDGVFRIKECGRDQKVQVRFRKPGYSPVMVVQQPTGVKGLVIAMDSKTYFEGRVFGPDGKPAANALIRADQGPKQGEGVIITTIWTATRSDAEGKYRLYVEPDAYAFEVKAPGVGVARLPKTPIGHGQAKALDIRLEPGVTFRATVVDAQTGRPVQGVRLFHWQNKGVDGRSDAQGEVTIAEMLPGKFDFNVEADGYARWWSEDAVSAWNRKEPEFRPGTRWQRNFDHLDFDLRPAMTPVKIVVEKGVRITGKVVDPDGKPVAGATVAPALTGTGNSLTGDTRFSVATKADGTFTALLPASGAGRYNLVAHDGKYGEWRKWANGVLPPIQTTPGQVIGDVTLTLTKPAVVRGKVVDANGKPVAHREVRAHAADKLENRYYDPTTTTKEDGTFELKCVRAGDQFIQVAPFWLTAEDAPGGSTKRLTLKAGETVEYVALVAEERR